MRRTWTWYEPLIGFVILVIIIAIVTQGCTPTGAPTAPAMPRSDTARVEAYRDRHTVIYRYVVRQMGEVETACYAPKPANNDVGGLFINGPLSCLMEYADANGPR